jgi:site-specific recombinase XerD
MTSAPNKQGQSRVIAQIGARPHQVTVTTRDIRGKRSVVVEWREDGTRRQWKATATTMRQAEQQAKAFARVKEAALVKRAERAANIDVEPAAPLTWLELAAAYRLAEGADWAEATLRNFNARVKSFTLFFGGSTPAQNARLETIDEFRAALRQLKREPAEINRVCTTVKSVYVFGMRRDLVTTKIPLYSSKKVRGQQAKRIPEFTPLEVAQLLHELKPRGATLQNDPQRPWRPWAISLLSAQTGKRTRSQILPLRWEEITWSRGGAVVEWLAANDKLRKEHVQPLPKRSAALLRLVRWLLRREGYTGPLVFPAIPTQRVKVAGRPYSYSALHHHIDRACVRASIERRRGQALHAFRRYAANEVLELTGGDIKKAGLWLNDADPRVLLRSYVRERDGEQVSIAEAMRKPDKAPVAKQKAVQDRRAGSNHQATNSEPTANAPAQAEASEDVTV